MKTQKVEIEIPDIDGYDFIGYRELNFPKDRELYIYMEFVNSEFEIDQVKCLNVNLDQRYFLYRKREPRKIIYEEVREDYLNRGDFYRDDDGDVNMWISDMQSREKHTIIKKVHDDFEANNG